MDVNTSSSTLQRQWETIQRIALLGLGRSETDAALWSIFQALQIGAERTEADALLEATALLSALRRTQRLEAPAGLNEKAAPAEHRAACPSRFAFFLELCLRPDYEKALPEAIGLLHEHQLLPPAELLPALLQFAYETPTHRSVVLESVGERGRWLARQHPDWQVLLPPAEPEGQWHNSPDRMDLLMIWRRQAPGKARRALQEQWKQLSPRQRALGLEALQVELTSEDESLLETGLDDSRKEVRAAAASVLLGLPSSQLRQTLEEWASQVVKRKGHKLHLEIPEELPSDSKRMGIQPKVNKLAGGLRQSWFNQLVERIPPVFWEDQLDWPPASIIQAFAGREYGDHLLHALNLALLRHPDATWMEALVEYWLTTGRDELWNQKSSKALLLKCPSSIFLRQTTTWLERQGAYIPPRSLLAFWLGESTHAWDDRLSRIVIGGFQDLLSTFQRNQRGIGHYSQLLQQVAYRSPPKMGRSLRTGWPTHRLEYFNLSVKVEEMLSILSFREDMHRSLSTLPDE